MGIAQMMLQCAEMVLPGIAKNKRMDYVLSMVSTLAEHGSVGMSEEDKDDFANQVIQKMKDRL